MSSIGIFEQTSLVVVSTTPKKEEITTTVTSVTSWNDKVSAKIFKKLKKPTDKTQSILSNLLFVVAIAAAISIYLTTYNIYSRSDTGGIATIAILFAMCVSTVWIIYGVFVVQNSIIVFGGISLFLANTILLFVVLYTRKYYESVDEEIEDKNVWGFDD